MVYIDEDMIPYYKCDHCGHAYCKGDVGRHGEDGWICIDCAESWEVRK